MAKTKSLPNDMQIVEEEERIRAWRVETFTREGFDVEAAERLAATDYDSLYARHLLSDLGYTHDQVIKLLA